jgi:D-glycero-alpha-D-manno-heptose-7-phosphate kinase
LTIRSKAPVRIDFAGGTTDLPAFASREGGAVVNATISRYAYCTLRPVPDDSIRIVSEDLQKYVEAENVKALEYDGNLDLLKAAVRRLGLECGLEIIVRCDAPPGSGTGASASVGVALIGMLDALRRRMGDRGRVMSRYDIAEMACSLEAELGIIGGKQDQFAAALGGINYMEFFPEGRVSVQRMELEPAVMHELEKHLVLCYSGESRLSGDTNDRMISAYVRGEERVVEGLRRVKAVAEEIRNALLGGRLEVLGELFEEETAARVRLADGVQTPVMQRLCDAAREAGAVGAKICGAGGGGCLLFCAAPDREAGVQRALIAAGGQLLSFSFDHRGLQVWQAPGET